MIQVGGPKGLTRGHVMNTLFLLGFGADASQVAEWIGTSRQMVWRISTGKSWQELTGIGAPREKKEKVRRTLLEEWESRVEREPNSGCWLWTGNTRPDGYGLICVDGRLERAHRVGYELFKGPLGKLDALHKCDNPPCVNPDHLFAGTDLDNVRDMDAKGRRVVTAALGEAHPMSKLTDGMVHNANILVRLGASRSDCAGWFGVGYRAIWNATTGRKWKHLTRPSTAATLGSQPNPLKTSLR